MCPMYAKISNNLKWFLVKIKYRKRARILSFNVIAVNPAKFVSKLFLRHFFCLTVL